MLHAVPWPKTAAITSTTVQSFVGVNGCRGRIVRVTEDESQLAGLRASLLCKGQPQGGIRHRTDIGDGVLSLFGM